MMMMIVVVLKLLDYYYYYYYEAAMTTILLLSVLSLSLNVFINFTSLPLFLFHFLFSTIFSHILDFQIAFGQFVALITHTCIHSFEFESFYMSFLTELGILIVEVKSDRESRRIL